MYTYTHNDESYIYTHTDIIYFYCACVYKIFFYRPWGHDYNAGHVLE